MPSYPIPSCPVTILGPNANGFSLEPKKSKEGMRTEMGSTRMRRYNTANVYVINAEFNFPTIQQFNDFLIWLKYETNYGNLWFKADWFSELGFDAGDWVFRFVSLPFSNTGYSQTHNATLLMGPYNSNVVSGDYTELGIGGEFIDEDFPFGYETYECTDDLTFYRIAHAHADNFLRVFDWNGSNYTKVGQDGALPSFVPFGITYLSTDLVAYIDKNSAGVNNYGGPGAELQAYSFNNDVWTAVGSPIYIGAGNSVGTVAITALSATRVAVAYMRTPFFGGRECYLATYDFNGSSWSLVGSILTVIANSSGNLSITKLSSNRVALGYGTLTTTTKLGTYDFNGSSWSLVGTLYSVPITTVNTGFVSAISSTKIAYCDADRKLRIYNFSGSVWSLDVAEFTGAGDYPAVISSTLIAVYHLPLEEMRVYKLTGTTLTLSGNEFPLSNGGYGLSAICSPYEF